MAAWTHIAHDTIIGGLPAASVTWSGISASYDHLCIKMSSRGDAGDYAGNTLLTFNASSGGTDYTETVLKASTTTPVSDRAAGRANFTSAMTAEGDILAATFASTELWIPHYSNTANFKQIFCQAVVPNNSASDNLWQVRIAAGLWAATPAAIDEITIAGNGSEFQANSTFDLYGITGA